MTNATSTSGRANHGTRAACAFLAGVLAIALVAVCVRRAAEPPDALGADAPAHVFSAARATAAYVRVFTDEGTGRVLPHPAGSDASHGVRRRLVRELEELGLAPVVEDQVVLRGGALGRVRNVVVPPRVRTQRGAVLLCAHYDSVAAGPGTGDDGAGVAALLEVARALRAEPASTRHPVMFLFDDGEELGLLGAQAFVEQSAWKDDVGVVINVEGRGTCGPSRMFETSPDNAELVRMFAASTAHPSANSLAYEIYKRMPNDTDLTVFKRAGLPGFNFAFVGGGRRYHTPLDDLAHLDPRSLQHHGENALALTRTLAEREGSFVPAGGDAVFTDVLSRAFVSWPAKYALPVALAPFAALVLLAWLRRRTHGVRARDLGRGAGLALAGALVAAVIAWLVDACVARAHGGVYPWPPGSLAAHASVVCAAACAVASCAGLARRARTLDEPRAAALGQCLGWSLLQSGTGAALGLLLAGASPLLVLPAAVSALVLAAATTTTPRTDQAPRFASVAVVATLLAAAQAVLLVALLHGLEEVIEFRTLDTPAVAGFAAAWALLLAPLGTVLALAPRRAALGTALAFACATAVALVCVVNTPASTASEPQPVFLAHVEREGESEARLYLRRFGSELPPSWPPASAFGAASENPFPWWARSMTCELARAPIGTPLGAADWTVVERADAHGDAPRRVRLRLASPLRARRVVLEIPRGVELARIHAPDGHGVHVIDARLRGPRALDATGFADAPFELELAIDGSAPVRAELLEVRAVEQGPLRAWAETRPAGLAPRGEGDLAIGACFVTL